MDIEQFKHDATAASDWLKVIAHPERLMVLCQLTQGEVGVGELQANSALTQSAFSQHLTVLRKHGMIKPRKVSQQVYYSLADERVEPLIGSLHAIFCQQEEES
ncbi:ArsR/SmtB family transcription factor [Vibrio sp. LaRot3]|uniref:ArsR/SmtB family transcription factor n=1 Tax=Vibrio sp. LaRot3 TaxID=2998829 RepID=UPI0022CDF8FC|nr:metalloregulator ArsR/SmtB family transcription factor [Vibrio sp. LaRot3]MDA0148402.1 metalloregulator ArsR/SmtB family transcription factor [Vibrio sp. LaRot3]